MRISDWGSDVCSSDLFCRCCQVQWTAGNPWERVLGGAGGIRTLDTLLAYTHFPGERLRPLGHRSACPGRHAPYRDRHLFASRSDEHTSELQSLLRISYDGFCLKKKTQQMT